ncbi:MAG: universal stress protein [Trueperaceae bacterium]|nr:universal stress protein [Trueperaceae bacterium]
MYANILVPVDGSDCSTLAFNHALSLAKALGSSLTLLTAVEDPVQYVYGLPEVGAYLPELYNDLKKSAEQTLANFEQEAQAAGLKVKTILAEHSKPEDAILDNEASFDLIVMGTHGRRGLNRMVLGSVAESVLRRSSKPHLFVREQD